MLSERLCSTDSSLGEHAVRRSRRKYVCTASGDVLRSCNGFTSLLAGECKQPAYIRIVELIEVSIPGGDRKKHWWNPQDRELIGFCSHQRCRLIGGHGSRDNHGGSPGR